MKHLAGPNGDETWCEDTKSYKIWWSGLCVHNKTGHCYFIKCQTCDADVERDRGTVFQ